MSKINKLGKSTFVIAILSFILVAVLAFGGTYAYFSDESNVVTSGDITVGTLRFDGNATFDNEIVNITATKVVPGQPVVDGAAEVTIEANIDYYVRAIVTETITLAAAHNGIKDDGEAEADNCTCADKTLAGGLISNTAENADWYNAGNGIYYFKAVKTGNDTASFAINATVNPQAGQVGSEHYMGATITYTVKFEIVQADFIVKNSGNIVEQGADVTADNVAAIAEAFAEAKKPIATGA